MNSIMIQITLKTELDTTTWHTIAKELFPNGDVVVSEEVNIKGKSFDWNAETVIAEKEEDLTPYYEIADRLYTKLLGDNRSFSDWEYKFISSNYEVAEAKGYYTPKQREWLKKLEEKYLV